MRKYTGTGNRDYISSTLEDRVLDDLESVPPRLRPVDLIDPDDPAYLWIMRAGLELMRYDFDLSDPDITMRCVKVGREDYQRQVAYVVEDVVGVSALASPFSLREGEVVYYARIGDRVKIGTTRQLRRRMVSIAPDELMVTEPGNRILEAVRHEQFEDLRLRGEWFRLDDRLLGHIEELREIARLEEGRDQANPDLPLGSEIA